MPPSRRELDACVSMIVLQLPFPPLPVVAVNGEGRDAIASSHDLLSQAIAANMLGGAPDPAVDARKQAVLRRLNEEVAAEWVRAAAPAGGAAAWRKVGVEGIYDAYCRLFREYMACYPGSPDLRLRGHADVFPGMSVYEQAAQHLHAHEAYVAAEGGMGVPPVHPGDSYADMLRIYAMGMFLDSLQERPGVE
jgi:hypothetical protein